MELERGTSLGHYEIEELIGAGGMGQVYRARDTKLGRAVAIKVLPEALARDKERLDRFEREARLLAALNHPNIATLHGMERSGDVRFLVMELVEGETLGERIARGAIPLDEAVALFVQIAEGLEAAHEKGIVHRDLKPANIMITPEGRVKILDFGLAKALSVDVGVSAETSQSPTLTKGTRLRHGFGEAGTQLGAIMGTASYMSPEQARARPIDQRTDIWAFGCCLYEALTQKKAFDGETVSDIIGSVLRDEPDTSVLPPGVSRLVERCLNKNPRERVRDIGDARWALKEPMPPTVAVRASLSFVPWILLALSMAAVFWFAWRDVPKPSPVTRFTISLPENVRIVGDSPEQHVAFSPGGSRIVYSAIDDSQSHHLYLLERDEFTATRIPDTEGAQNPFFSPDGNWIGFFAGGGLKKISLAGGAPITICDADPSPGASWGGDDIIIFPDSYDGGLVTVSAGGGEPETLTTFAPGDTGHRWPQHLPEERILFSIRAETGTRIAVESVRTDERKTLFDESSGVTRAIYLPSGHLLYDQPGNLLVSAFDVDALELVGTPASVLDGAPHNPGGGGLTYIAVSKAGDVVYVPVSATRTMTTLRTWSEDGAWSELAEARRRYRYLALDPDGRRVALNVFNDDGKGEIWLYDIVRSSLAPLSREGAAIFRPVWTPDGRRVSFALSRVGLAPNLYWTPADGSGNATELLAGGTARFPISWTPDETALVWANSRVIEVLRTDGDGGSEAYLTVRTQPDASTLSRDGRWLAYVSGESGRLEVYVTSFPTPGARVLVSTEGGDLPKWSADGSRLYFLSGARIMVVDVDIETAEESFVVGVPVVVAEADVIDFDVTPDDRIIAIWPEGSRGWDRLHVVLNWVEELDQLVPVE